MADISAYYILATIIIYSTAIAVCFSHSFHQLFLQTAIPELDISSYWPSCYRFHMTRYGFKAVINTPREFVCVSAPPDSYRAFGRLKFSWMESAKRIAALGQYQRHLCRVREAPMWKMMRVYSKCQMQCRCRLAWLPMTNRWFLFGF